MWAIQFDSVQEFVFAIRIFRFVCRLISNKDRV